MKLITLIAFFVFTINTQLYAAVQSEMRSILKSYIQIIPYTSPDKKLDDKKLLKYLGELKESFKNTKHELYMKSPSFKSNITFINSNILHITKGVKLKHYGYAREQVKHLVSNCISCHAQLPSKKYDVITHKYADIIKDNIKTNYERGLFAYFLRDYEKAVEYLKKDISKLKDSYAQEERASQVLKIYTMSLKDFSKAKNFVEGLRSEKNNHIDKDLLSKWIKDLNEWSKVPNQKLKQKKISKLIKKYLTPIESSMQLGNQFSFQVIFYSMHGILSNYLLENPKTTLKTEILYWFGLLENTSPSIYSLGDLYLVDCIKMSPKSKYAKKCYDSYSKSITFGFSGSAGTHIPADIQLELDELQKLIEK